MYVRVTPGKRRKDGSKVDYVQLAHNVWDSGKGRSQVQVIHTFGRTDQLDEDGMRRLAGSMLRYLDGSTAAAGAGARATRATRIGRRSPHGPVRAVGPGGVTADTPGGGADARPAGPAGDAG